MCDWHNVPFVWVCLNDLRLSEDILFWVVAGVTRSLYDHHIRYSHSKQWQSGKHDERALDGQLRPVNYQPIRPVFITVGALPKSLFARL